MTVPVSRRKSLQLGIFSHCLACCQWNANDRAFTRIASCLQPHFLSAVAYFTALLAHGSDACINYLQRATPRQMR